MDGIQALEDILVVAATNRPDRIDKVRDNKDFDCININLQNHVMKHNQKASLETQHNVVYHA